MNKVLKEAVFKEYSTVFDIKKIESEYDKAIKNNNRKIVVLDDDPTGVQTIHDIPVYTDWEFATIESGFNDPSSMFFILTNSRSFTSKETVRVHREIAQNIYKASKILGKDFIIISRSDSTLRGHYPLETKVLKDTLEEISDISIDAEVVFPFFKEGGRFTIGNIHYVQENEYLVPASETEFAKDKTFGYKNSHLGKWIEEKTEGRFLEKETQYISLEDLRKADLDGIAAQLMIAKDFSKIVVNAIDYVDVKVFTIALLKALDQGKRFIFRTAASFTKVIGGVTDKALLTRQDLIKDRRSNGGIIIIGSHVKKTTEQLEELKSLEMVRFVEFNQHLIVNPNEIEMEVWRVVDICDECIGEGKTVAVYTRRDRLDFNTGNSEDELKLAVKISHSIASIIHKLKKKPAFVIAKGGITSSDVATIGLEIKKAVVAGQIKEGIPVWITGDESRFPGIPYIIFPGNVGTRKTLKEVVEILSNFP